MGFVARLLIAAIGLWLAATLVPGIWISSGSSLLLAALLLGLVNAFIRPLVLVLTLPITVVTLGVFILVINAAMFGLVASLLDGFAVRGFFSALLGSLVVSATSWLASQYVGPRGRVEVLVVRRGSGEGSP